MPVNDDDRRALEAIDDALGFLMDDEREIVLSAFAAHREQARRQALVDAAKVAEDLDIDWSLGTAEHREAITAAIRAL